MTRVTGAMDKSTGGLQRADMIRALVRGSVHLTRRCGLRQQAEAHWQRASARGDAQGRSEPEAS